MAAVTKNLGFGVTVTTTYEQPYHLARRLSTVDHLTKGRLGWNVRRTSSMFVNQTTDLVDYRSSPAISTQPLATWATLPSLK